MKNLELYWSEIPVGRENAVGYPELTIWWDRNEREVRQILHALSSFDNGDDYILIRSAKKGGGFYRTDNPDDIKEYRKECMAKGLSNLAPVKKINRVLNANREQLSLYNNLRFWRENRGFTQAEICEKMHRFDEHFDIPLLSKMENSICIPTFAQCKELAGLYSCEIADLINYDVFLE